jgi:hypothetical protein
MTSSQQKSNVFLHILVFLKGEFIMYSRSHHRNLNQLIITAFMLTLILFSYMMPYFFAVQSLAIK